MSSHATTDVGDTVAFDLRGSGPAVVFVAGAGPHSAVAPAVPHGRTATAPGRDHSWEPEAMAALLIEFVREVHRTPSSQAAGVAQ